MGLEDRDIVRSSSRVPKRSSSQERFLDEEQIKQYTDYALASRQELGDKFKRLNRDPDIPAWAESIQANSFIQMSKNPDSVAEILSLAFYRHNRQGVRDRQYGNQLDKAYRLPDGSIDQLLLEQDRFIVRMEGAYYRSKGQIPLQWFIDNADDMDLLEGVPPEIILQLNRIQSNQVLRREAQAKQESDFERGQQAIFPGLFEITPDQAAAAQTNVGTMEMPFGEDGETVDSAITRIKGQVKKGWFDFAHGVDFLWDSAWSLGTQWDVIPAAEGAEVLEGAGILLQGVAEDPHLNFLLQTEALQEQEKRKITESLGMGLEQYILKAGFGDAFELATKLPELDPKAWAGMLAAAGGDEDLAQDMVVDAILFNDDAIKTAKEQQDLYNSTLDYQLEQLENEDFTFGARLLDILGAYGNLVETLAVGVTLAAVSILGEDDLLFWDDQYLQDVNDFDTPASVLGIEGTLIGLIFNFGSEAILDPANIFFAPGLRGALGSLDDVARHVSRNFNKVKVVQTAEVIRSMTGDTVAVQTLLSSLEATGMNELFLAVSRGHLEPVVGKMVYSTAKVANATSEVSITMLDSLLKNLDIADDVIEAAGKRINSVGVAPIEVTVNPATGRAAITKGADDAIYYGQQGKDAVPVTIILDTKYGMVDGPILQETIEAALAPAGTMRIRDLFDLREVNVRKSLKTTLDGEIRKGGDVVDDLKASIMEEGFNPRPTDAPVEVVYNPKTGEHFLADGNHRVTALHELQKADESINVIVRPMSAEELAVNAEKFEWGKDAGVTFFKSKTRTDLFSSLTDESLEIVEWGKGISMDGPGIVDVDGVIHVRPRAILPDEMTLGKLDKEALMDIYQKHLLMGGDPFSANKTAFAMKVGTMFGDMLRSSDSKLGQWIDNFITPVNANAHFDLQGAFGRTQLNQFGMRLYSSVRDARSFEPFQMRIQQFYRQRGVYRQEAAELTAEVVTLQAQRDAIIASVGGKIDDGAQEVGVKLAREQAKRHREVTDITTAFDVRINAIVNDQMKAVQAKMNDYTELLDTMDDMMNDFNRRHIATRDDWKWAVIQEGDDKGLVDWNLIMGRDPTDISRDRRIIIKAKKQGISLEAAAEAEVGFVPESIREVIGVVKSTGQDIGKFLDDAHDLLQHKSSYKAPASPIEIMAAANGGPKALKTTLERLNMDGVSEFAHQAHTAWILDKVLTPRTGITVAMDELISGLHAGGVKNIFRFMEDRAVIMADHVASLKGGAAWERLPTRWKDRLTALEEYPIYLRQQERAFLEMGGVGFDEITFKPGFRNNQEYYAAAQRTAQGFLSDPGFQAYLKGGDALNTWLKTDTTAARVRSMEFYDVAAKQTRTGATFEDIQASYAAIEKWMMKGIKAKDRPKALARWREGAETAAGKGSTSAGPTQLPDWVLEGFESVTGNVRQTGRLQSAINKGSDRIFQRPLDYRRGFNAEMVREFERARLEKLFASQGKKIVSEAEMQQILLRNNPGLSNNQLQAGVPHMSQELAEQYGIVSERYVRELIEAKVTQELEGRMYSFTMESRAGRKVKGLAPFGKPYADMVGRWQRELFSRPTLRGWVNDTNFLNMGNIANRVTDALPFNPRAAGFLSRIANTEFDLDRIQEDPLVGGAAQFIGLEKIDLSAGLFLPHEGDNPFNVLIPGLGIIPVGLMQLAFGWLAPDAVEDPLAYKNYIDQWAEWVPSLGFSKPQGIGQWGVNLFLGGGTGARAMSGVESVIQASTGHTTGANILTQNWKPRVTADRQVKLILSDPAFLDELAGLTGDLVDLGITALLDEEVDKIVKEANRATAGANLRELGTEFGIPARAVYESVNDNLQKVWIQGIDFMGLTLPDYINDVGPDGQRRAADWARVQFFDLEDWERDAVVSENPGLAVNLVSMWEWTDAGKNAAGVDNDAPYRTGGSTVAIARHDAYLDKGYIQPLGPKQLAINIIGTMLTAKERTAKAAYTEAAFTINEERWEDIPDEWKAWLQEQADEFVAAGTLPYRTGKELWRNYPDLAREMDIAYPPGLDDEGEEADGFSMPGALRAWGEEMPSSPEEVREEFGEDQWTISKVSPKLARLARALGLDWDEDDPDATIEMQDVYVATADSIARNRLDNPIFAHIDQGYRSWLAPRSSGQQAFTGHFGKILDASTFTEETRSLYKRNMVYIGEALDRRAAGDPSWRTVRDQSVAKFSRMVQDDAFRGTEYSKLWADAYGKQLGSLDWVPDTAPPIINEDGSANPNASQIFVVKVLDGDTLDMTFGRNFGGSTTNVRLRLLGWNAQELGNGGGPEHEALETAIKDAVEQGLPITIVRDPDRYGNTDMYGRLFGWLYIGTEVWYNADTMIPRNE